MKLSLLLLIVCFQVAKAKWLALWNDRMDRMPDSKDDHAIMEFMRDKYEKKRWFSVPDPAPKQEEAPRRPSLGKPPQKEKKTVSVCVRMCVSVVCVRACVLCACVHMEPAELCTIS